VNHHIQQGIELLKALVNRASQVQKFGSVSQRFPALGKMRRCPYCRARRRENASLPCCTATVADNSQIGNKYLDRDKKYEYVVHDTNEFNTMKKKHLYGEIRKYDYSIPNA